MHKQEILQTARKILQTCMGVKPGENVLIISDTATSPLIGEALFDVASEMGCEVMLVKMLPRAHSGIEPPTAIAKAMNNVDVVLAPTSVSLTHTKARIKCCCRARIATMPGITEEMMLSGGMTADYEKVSRLVLKALSKLSSAKEIRITTEIGTDITFDVQGCKWLADTGLCNTAGCCTNLPGGEVYVAPKNAEGELVVDGSISGIGMLASPVRMSVRQRYVCEIKGNKAKELIASLEGVGRQAYNIAELGFGMNPNAIIRGNSLEDEKVMGTIHVGLGDSSTIGGDVVAGIHIDAIITKPNIFVDGKKVSL